MKNLKLKPLILALGAVFLLTRGALANAPQAESKLREEITTSPGRSITPSDEQLLSSTANKVLFHIANAADALAGKQADQAKQELAQADTLLNIIDSVAPTTIVKDRIWTADNKLKYENTEEVTPNAIPIYSTLGEEEDFGPVKDKADKKADVVAEAQSDDLYYEELDLPLASTRHFVAMARAQIVKNQLNEARQALQAALDSVDFVNVSLPEPLVAAKTNLRLANQYYKDGRMDDAKVEVGKAIVQLKAAEQVADSDSKADVAKLMGDAESMQSRIDGKDVSLSNDLQMLWRHTEALADRAVESTSVGWARLRDRDDAVRTSLIEAKRYVAYAGIDTDLSKDPAKARADLNKADDFLSQAEKAAANKDELLPQIQSAKGVIDSLLSGQSQTSAETLGQLKHQIRQVIDKA